MHGRSYRGPSPARSCSAWRSRWRCRPRAWLACAVIAVIAWLCLPTSSLSAQTSTAPDSPSPITSAETAKQRLDLSLLIEQRNYWKDRSERFERAVTQLSEKLASTEQLLKDSPDPRALLEEILSLRQQLRDAMASLDESRASLASADQQVAEAEERIRLAEQKAKRLERSRNGWRAGAIAAIAAAVAAGIWAAMK